MAHLLLIYLLKMVIFNSYVNVYQRVTIVSDDSSASGKKRQRRPTLGILHFKTQKSYQIWLSFICSLPMTDPNGAGICKLTWLGYIDGIHVTIYTSNMDPMGKEHIPCLLDIGRRYLTNQQTIFVISQHITNWLRFVKYLAFFLKHTLW